jgi:hypothetical protein
LTVAESASPPRAERAAPKPGYLAAIGLATGLGALAASSCCVLPLALAGLGAGASVFTVLEGPRAPAVAANGGKRTGACGGVVRLCEAAAGLRCGRIMRGAFAGAFPRLSRSPRCSLRPQRRGM